MKDKIIDKLSITITILIVLLVVFLGYNIINRINSRKEIKNNIKEIFKDYEIKDLKDLKNIKIKIHSKTSYQSRISYNVELTSNKYDTLDYENQTEIIKYIKNISFKGNNKKYSINKVTIYSKENTYTYHNIFKKNNTIYGTSNKYADTANNIKDKIKDKLDEIKENITN